MNQELSTQNEEPVLDFSAVGPVLRGPAHEPERVVKITVQEHPVLIDEAGRQYIEDERGRRFVDEIPKNQSIRFTPFPTA